MRKDRKPYYQVSLLAGKWKKNNTTGIIYISSPIDVKRYMQSLFVAELPAQARPATTGPRYTGMQSAV